MKLGTTERPLRVAIVGSGPAGFYAAGALGKADVEVVVDIFDRLPVPFGLVRSGVAPDHAKIKSVTRLYDKIAQEDFCSFYGNVEVGEDISVEELQTYYDAIVLAHGAESDRKLGIPGEDLSGSRTATEFVGWYNCHPSYVDRKFDLKLKKVAVIGQGNVAVDVARILLRPIEELAKTDIAQHTLDALADSTIEEVHMIGRRGAVQGAFSDKELKELGEIPNCDVIVNAKELELDEAGKLDLESAEKVKRANFKTLQDFSQRQPQSGNKRLVISFFKSPVEMLGSEKLEGMRLERNELVGEQGARKARGTGNYEEMDCDLVFRSVGYLGEGLAGVPFHERWGVYLNDKGRVLDEDKPIRGLYTAGWIKRGPSGVIGTNKACSVETVKSLLEDLPGIEACENPQTSAVLALLKERGVRTISYEDWQKIDALEIERGKKAGKEREKFITAEEIFAALN